MATSNRLLLALSLSILAACATRPPGDPPTAQSAVPFTRTAPAAPGFTNIYPFAAASDWRIQGLYLATEVKGAGNITGLRFVRGADNAVAVTCPAVTVRMGHSTLTALAAGFDTNVDASSLTTVAEAITVTIPAGTSGSWFDVPLAKPFEYDGLENLVVDLETPATCSGTITIGTLNGANRRVLSAAANAGAGTYEHSRTSGAVDAFPPGMGFLFAGGEDRILAGVSGANFWPFANVATRVQTLQLASDIASQAGSITSVGFEVQSVTTAATYTYTMRMGHTDATVLTTTFSANANDWVTVASSVTIKLGLGTPPGTWIWLPMQRPFEYDGRRNVVVEVISAPGGGDRTFLSTGAREGARVSDLLGGGSLFVDSVLYHVAFRFKGAAVFATRTPLLSTPFVGTGGAGQIQQLLRAVQIGSSGVVNRIALRAAAPTVAATIPIKIYIGQTSKTGLAVADTYASNMEESVLAFSGTATIPAGLSRGDWIEYPLQNAFQYEAGKSLVIVLMHDAATPTSNQSAFHQGQDALGVAVGRVDNSVDLTGAPSFAANGSIDFRIGMQ